MNPLSQSVWSTTYTLDLAAPLVQVLVMQNAGSKTAYEYGLTRIGEQQLTGWVYHLSDALGSVRQLADANAQIVLARGYTPYGEPLWSQGMGRSAYGFTGEALDTYKSRPLTLTIESRVDVGYCQYLRLNRNRESSL